MQYLFSTNFRQSKCFPQFSCHLYIIFCELILLFEHNCVFQSYCQMFLEVVECRRIYMLWLLLTLLVLRLLRMRILLFWLLIDNRRRRRWNQDVNLTLVWRERWKRLVFSQKLFNVDWRITSFEIGYSLKNLTLSILATFILIALLFNEDVTIWILFNNSFHWQYVRL
jgi:hypothetical protein